MWPFTWSSRKPREKYSLENLKFVAGCWAGQLFADRVAMQVSV